MGECLRRTRRGRWPRTPHVHPVEDGSTLAQRPVCVTADGCGSVNAPSATASLLHFCFLLFSLPLPQMMFGIQESALHQVRGPVTALKEEPLGAANHLHHAARSWMQAPMIEHVG